MSGSDVKTEREEISFKHYIPSILGWVVPGAGHFFLGHRTRAVLLFILVAFSLLFGLYLDGKVYRIERDKPMTYAGVFAHLGLGPAYFLLRSTAIGRGRPDSPTFTYGKTFITTAGLMNILLILDAFDISTGRKKLGEGRKEARKGGGN